MGMIWGVFKRLTNREELPARVNPASRFARGNDG